MARMASSSMVMAVDQNGFVEEIIRGNIDIALVGENALCVLPIQEMGAKGWRDGAVHRLECL